MTTLLVIASCIVLYRILKKLKKKARKQEFEKQEHFDYTASNIFFTDYGSGVREVKGCDGYFIIADDKYQVSKYFPTSSSEVKIFNLEIEAVQYIMQRQLNKIEVQDNERDKAN